MRFLPSDSFEIQTSMSIEEVVEKMKAEIEDGGFSGRHKIVSGEISRQGFKIARLFSYSNAFVPIVHGTFKPGQSGVSVIVKIQLHPLTTIFICAWYAAMLGFMGDFSGLLTGRMQIHPEHLIQIMLIIFPWVLASVKFWPEAAEDKRMLIDILK